MGTSGLGQGLVLVAALLACGAAVATIQSGAAARQRLADWLLTAVQAVLLAAVVLLLASLVRTDFRLDYVVRQTSHALPTPYRFAALWAGQEGTILLWAFMLTLLAGWLRAGRDGLRHAASGLILVVATALLVLLLIKSPFAATAGPTPEDGHGLNPLLQNPWMMIHPPVLFIGYSLLLGPLALALAAWWRGEGEAWIESGRRLALLGWVFLGAGMMLGGYWAYITLGWGGFWAWDPVENASLVPWLFATALLHSLSLHRRTGSLARMAYVLAAVTGVMVLYGSYLTRSGVLDGFSVHSFESLGAGYNAAWLALVLGPTAVAVLVLVRRRGAVPCRPLPDSGLWMLIGTWVLTLMGGLVWVGMSMPLLSRLGGGKGFAVEAGFYNRTQTVLFLACAVSLVAFMRPRRSLTWAAMAVLGALAALQLARVVSPEHVAQVRLVLLVTALGCGAMVGLALSRLLDACRVRDWRLAGAAVAHAGAAVLALGAMLSGPGERSERLTLVPGMIGKTAWGAVTFVDATETADHKTELALNLGREQGTALMYEAAQGQMRNPVLFHRVWGDVYLEPEALSDPQAGQTVKLKKGESTTVAGLKVTFEAFEMAGMHGESGSIRVGAKLSVDAGQGPQSVTPAVELSGAEGERKPVPAKVGAWTIELDGIDADSHAVELRLRQQEAAAAPRTGPELVLRVTRKPAIGLVWLGTILLLLGGALALRRPRMVGLEVESAG